MAKKKSEEKEDKLVFTQSRLNDFMSCERLEFYRYRAGNGFGIKPVRTESFFLEGEFGHYALMHWYQNWKRGGIMLRKNMMGRIKTMIEDQGELSQDDYNNLQAKMSAMVGACHAYKSHYKKDFDKWEILAVEEEFEIDIAGVVFRGKIDLAVRDKEDDTKGFVEHKFLTQFKASDYDTLPISLQQLIYSLGFKAVTGELPQWYMWNVIKKSSLRRKGMTQKKDGSRPIPEPLLEYENRVMDQYVNDPDKMLIRTPPRLIEPEALKRVVGSVEYHILNFKKVEEAKSMPPMRYSSCTGRYGTACTYANACKEEMTGNKEGWNAPACRGLYCTKEKQHEELS